MNIQRVTELRNHISRLPPEHFSMDSFGSPTNPCGCIAHHAARIFSPGSLGGSKSLAAQLDIDIDTAKTLTYAFGQLRQLDELTTQDAVEALDRLLKGEPPWM